MVIKIISPLQSPKTITLNNSVLMNRGSFTFAKMCAGAYYPPINKISYDDVRPLIIAINEYAKENPEFDFLEVLSANGQKVLISF